ncbi:MAG: Gfo/Idh/MocA family oxidoreductase [Caldilineaceae bacterium SB0662_bin_9]|uniref:Gfo/Idh/MocA family oxidoreductase n=1 Tax=Caldilineaceae bacterium SB0662_bin_9 TaxID=2605258 RepID=A0A6B1DSX8_9CHLR|nr:Gfo/Idh/MocA family oxidoreductase [Caldilineaceae bacterium]MYD90297.1 Gfo/Idh/MocA family oxidoreductase [Caldilineaceae bacterium SB0662_bin_9]
MASTSAVQEAVTRTAIIGCGGMARNHLRSILEDPRGTHVSVVCEPMAENYELTCLLFEEAGVAVPENVPDLDAMLDRHAADLDAVFIVTPHAMHHDHVVASLDAGLDVLVEKPMVVSKEEAERVIAKRDETGKLVTVAFQGSLSPQIRWASEQLHDGPYGRVLAISGTVWQSWKGLADGRWRLDPHVSGGGFMFDTGAHLMNTIADLAGEDFVEVAAWLNNDDMAVDIMAAAMGRLQSGTFVTIHGCGNAVKSCSSTIHVFAEKAHLKACMWGRWVEVQEDGDEDFRRVELPAMRTAWHRFLDVRAGRIENPSPPEVGLRMLRLWDAIKESAARNGQVVPC